MKQNKLFLNFFVNRNWKKLTDSRKRTKISADNRKSHHPIETLTFWKRKNHQKVETSTNSEEKTRKVLIVEYFEGDDEKT